MNKNKIAFGCIGLLVGYLIFMLVIDLLGKAENVPMSLKPIESLEAYFFVFVFGLGTMGRVLGVVLLLGFFIASYFIGTWMYKMIFKS